MRNIFYIFVFTLYSSILFAVEYEIGSGSQFKLTNKNDDPINISIYFTESSFTKLGIEYFFSTSTLFSVQAWQQYRMGITPKGLSLEEGYIQSPEMTKPEIMTKEFLNNNENGVNVEDFFFTKEADIEKFKIGLESIEVPAGAILSNHYQKKRAGQTVDFWISEKAGAIGLVKLISKGNTSQTYKIELMSLLKNVKAKINPKAAVPLTEKGKMFLGKAGKK